MNNTMTKVLLSLTLALGLMACSDDDNESTTVPAQAMVQTIAPDYSTSEVAAIDIENQQVTTGYYIKDASDYTIVGYNNAVYHLGRRNHDTITKYSTDALGAQVWSYSSQDDGDSTSRNLYTLAFASDTQAYVIRYASDKIWIINPEAENADDFKTGELDLSSYVENNNLNTPRPSAAVVHNGKLFVAMQRLDSNWSTQTAYIAVFDTTTGEEIETNANDQDTVKGIPITGLNPLENSLTLYGDTLYVTTNDSGSSSDKANSKIESIDTDTYELNTVLSVSDISATEVASIQMTAIVDDTLGYFITTRAISNSPYTEASTLYQFNPSTGVITEENVVGTGSEDINFIVLDENDFLWLGVGATSAPGIDIVDTISNEKYTDRLLTNLNPNTIAFINQ